MWIYNRWRSIAGSFSLVWASIVSALDWGGRVDYARTHIGDFVGAKGVINLFLAPPLWLFWPTTFAGLGLIWWDAHRTRSPARLYGQRRSDLNPYLAIAAASAVVCIGAMIAYVVVPKPDPIRWEYTSGSPLNWMSRSGEPLWILGFQVRGYNDSNRSIDPRTAYIQTDLTSQVFNLQAVKGGSLSPLSKVIISPNSQFNLAVFIPTVDISYSGGMPANDFRNKIGAFTFFFNTAEYSYSKHFSLSDVEDIISQIAKDRRDNEISAKRAINDDGIIDKP